MNQPTSAQPPAIALPGLTLGFATAVAMWGVGYITHLGGAWAPPALVFVLLAAVLVLGGFCTARMTPAKDSWKPTLIAGLTTSLVNFLILGSVLANPGEGEEPMRANWALIALGSVLAQTLLVMIGGHFGSKKDPDDPGREKSCDWWLSRFGIVAAFSALPVILSGGIVTTTGTGMAVPDWPATFGDNMFLFSLSKMTGGVYYEHAHRLFGSLVGLTTVVFVLACATHSKSKPLAFLAFLVLAGFSLSPFFIESEESPLHIVLPLAGIIGAIGIALLKCGWRYAVAITALSLVIAQGSLGGLRVLADSTVLAMAHGISGQVTFALLCLLGAFFSPLWRRGPEAVGGDRFARTLSLVLLIVLVFQVFLGAGARHFDLHPAFLHTHILGAVIVAVLAPMAGFRHKAKHKARPPLEVLGVATVHTMILQFVLGVFALLVVIAYREKEETQTLEIVVRTAHQATGALLLGAASLLAAWSFRLISTRNTPSPE